MKGRIVDPITDVLLAYNRHLRDGGQPASLARFPIEPHKKERMLHASSILLCDRKAAFDVMGDRAIEPVLRRLAEWISMRGFEVRWEWPAVIGSRASMVLARVSTRLSKVFFCSS